MALRSDNAATQSSASLDERTRRWLLKEADAILSSIPPLEEVHAARNGGADGLAGSLAQVLPRAHIIADGVKVRRLGPPARIDDSDRLHTVEFWHEGRRATLERQACRRVDELAHWTAHHLSGDAAGDMPLIRAHLLRWLEARVNGECQTAWLDSVDDSLRSDSEKHVFVLPVEGLHVEASFAVGPVEFVFLTQEDARRATERIPDEVARRELVVERIEHELAGQVCARVAVAGAGDFAARRAGLLVDEALDLLRFFHPSSFDVFAKSWIGRRGQVIRRSSVLYREDAGAALPFTSSLESGFGLQHIIGVEDLPKLNAVGLGRMGPLVGAPKATPFQDEAYAAVRRISRGADLMRAEDRLVNAFVAVESLLLRNSHEAIKETVARRGAVILSRNHAQNESGDVLRAGYKVRSNLLHHARPPAPSEMDAVNRALGLCWEIVRMVFGVAHLHRSRRAYIAAVEQVAPPRAGAV